MGTGLYLVPPIFDVLFLMVAAKLYSQFGVINTFSYPDPYKPGLAG